MTFADDPGQGLGRPRLAQNCVDFDTDRIGKRLQDHDFLRFNSSKYIL